MQTAGRFFSENESPLAPSGSGDRQPDGQPRLPGKPDDVDEPEIPVPRFVAEEHHAQEAARGAELVVAYDESTVTDSKTDNSGGNEYTVTTTTQEKTPVMSGGELVVLKEKNPEIVGVLVVAEGADDIGVRLELLNAAATVLQVDKKIITVSVKG